VRSYVKQKKKWRSPAATKNLTELKNVGWVKPVIIIIIMIIVVWIFFFRRDIQLALLAEIPIPGRDACSETVFHNDTSQY